MSNVVPTSHTLLGTGYLVHGTGYWLQGTGYRILGTGYWVLGTKIRHVMGAILSCFNLKQKIISFRFRLSRFSFHLISFLVWFRLISFRSVLFLFFLISFRTLQVPKKDVLFLFHFQFD